MGYYTVKDYLARMDARLTKLDQGREEIRRDQRWTPEHKTRLLREHDESNKRELQWDAQSLFGLIDEAGNLQVSKDHGLLWNEYDAARADLQKARDEGDGLNPTRLQNAMLSLPARIKGMDRPDDFEKWYDKANTYDKRAAQLTGRVELPKRWGADVPGGTYDRLQKDGDAMERTPAVVAAEERVSAIGQAIGQGHQYVRVAASRLSEPTMADGGFFSRLARRIHRIDNERWERVNPDRVFMPETWQDAPAPNLPDDSITRKFETDSERMTRIMT